MRPMYPCLVQFEEVRHGSATFLPDPDRGYAGAILREFGAQCRVRIAGHEIDVPAAWVSPMPSA